jgi:maleate isomerase
LSSWPQHEKRFCSGKGNSGAMSQGTNTANRPPDGMVEADAAPARRSAPLRVALIALASDHGIRGEMGLLLGRRAELHLARVSAPDKFNAKTLTATTADIGRAVRWMGLTNDMDVAAYGCTSATVIVGEDVVARSLQTVLPGVPATTPITAARSALSRLRARRIALLTPYPRAIHRAIGDHLTRHGLEIVDERGLGIATDREITDYPPQELRARVMELDRRGAEAIFVSCTSLRIAGIIGELESATGLPIVTSNQALAWHCLELAGRPTNLRGFGRLLTGH